MRLLASFLVLLASLAVPSTATADDFETLLLDFDEWHYRERSAFSLASAEASRLALKDFRVRLDAVDEQSLPADAWIDYALLDHMIEESLVPYEHGRFVLAVGLDHGVHKMLSMATQSRRLASIDDCWAYLRWLEALTQNVDHTVELLREGLRRDMTQPHLVMTGVLEEIDRILATSLAELGHPFGWAWDDLPIDQRNEPWAHFNRDTLPKLQESLVTLRRFIAEQYLPNCRQSISRADMEGGEALYRDELATLTTTTLSPQQLHELGLQEVHRLRPLIIDAIRQTDFIEKHPEHLDAEDDALFDAFRTVVVSEPEFYFESTSELLSAARDIAKRVDPWLAPFFNKLPRVPFGIFESSGGDGPYSIAIYRPGDLSDGYSAAIYIGTAAREVLPRFMLPSLILHEGMPGHHLQIGLAGELRDAPRFRREAWLPAFGEGWAMYAEGLGFGVMMYEDPYEVLGLLQWQMLRACRLVIDTGINALGWSLEDAERFLRAHTIINDRLVQREVVRTLSWPGQGATYTVGYLQLVDLRSRAEEQLGEAFDVREFHNAILSVGAATLPMIERQVNHWIDVVQESAEPEHSAREADK